MFILDPTTTDRYLRDRGHLDTNETVRVSELSGGVSNQVLLVERGRGDRFVLKQAREQLRVQQEWKCDVRRIWREIDVLRLCGEILKGRLGTGEQEPGIRATVPEILFEDRENFCYAMTAAPVGHRTWKEMLLEGEVDQEIAVAVGRLLGTLHAATWRSERVASSLQDRSYFEALRIDPYYRRIAEMHPILRMQIEALIASLEAHPLSLVHGDFSPKNLLVSPQQVLLIDFEVGHHGDPAFDVGFFFSHLFLKLMRAGAGEGASLLRLIAMAWVEYSSTVKPSFRTQFPRLERRGVQNLAGCLLARVDGKSPVDYLTAAQQAAVRVRAVRMLDGSIDNMGIALAYFWQGISPT